ncbi:MAG: TetR family transcriptional regulator [Propionibacterium sp.]|nr:TetR family transcriptional regulator [Propionibacterium sp.]
MATSRDAAAEAMRARLVQAAIEQLSLEGMRGVTHRRVEQRAEVSQGLVKYHFATLDGLIEAVVEELAALEIDAVMEVTPAQMAEANETGRMPTEVWVAARDTWHRLTAHPHLTRARYEIFLHASRHPELQGAIGRGRRRFLDATAASLSMADDPVAAARMVIALVDGLLLHQLSAPEDDVDTLAPAYLLAAGTAAQLFPLDAGPRV